jgi:hypothetical protein
MFRVYRAFRLSLMTVVFVGAMALAFWRAPFLMLPIVGGAFALFFFLSWLVAPKKVPWSTPTNEPSAIGRTSVNAKRWDKARL